MCLWGNLHSREKMILPSFVICFWLVLFTSLRSLESRDAAKTARTTQFFHNQNHQRTFLNHRFTDIALEGASSTLFDTSKDPDDKNITRNFVSATLGDNMVLQRDKSAVLWGYSKPGAQIVVTLLQETKQPKQKHLRDTGDSKEVGLVPLLKRQTNVDNDGLWRVKFPPQPASKIPHTIQVSSITTRQERNLSNVLFGDVYICGGQSNMEYSMPGQVNGTQIVQEAVQHYQHMRVVTIGCYTQSDTPLPDLQKIEKTWSLPSEESMMREGSFGRFSAVCWLFGKEISDALNNQVPLGLINNNFGGSAIEPWQKDGSMFNAMIYPYMVGPMAITGFTWYQGEANTFDQASANQYAVDFRTLIDTWRSGFQVHNAYFGFVQLSTWCPGKNPVAVAEMREAQMKVVPPSDDESNNTVGYATAADHGAGCNIHPPDKRVVGRRLGKSALALQYGHKDISWRSPTYAKARSIRRNVANVPNAAKTDDENSVSVVVEFHDVSEQGLYLLESPYNNQLDPQDFNCSGHAEGTCAWSSLLLNGYGWVDSKLDLLNGNKIQMTPILSKMARNRDNVGLQNQYPVDSTVLATSYGWGSVPMMQIYDVATDLPVLPWNEKILPIEIVP